MVSGSWYWAEQPDPLPQPIGTVPVPHPDVPGNDLAVAIKNGMPDKVSYLTVEFSALSPGSTVGRAILTVPEDTAGVSLNQAAAKIVAQPSKGFVAAGSSGAPIGQAPGADSGGPTVKGVRAPSGTWTFDLTPLLAAEVGGTKPANGVALVPDTNSDNFQIVWKAAAAVLDVTATPPPTTPMETSPGAVVTVATTPTAGGDLTGSLTAPSDLSGAPADVSTPAPPAPATLPVAAQAPTHVRLSRHSRPGLTLPFGLAVAAIVLLAIGTTAVLGERGEPAERRQGSVLRRIEQRPLETE
jgi:hypothetical protein